MVRIGIVGVGFMGWIHWLAARRLKGAQVTAVCSRDAKKLAGDWRGIRGNFGPPGEMVDLSGVNKSAVEKTRRSVNTSQFSPDSICPSKDELEIRKLLAQHVNCDGHKL